MKVALVQAQLQQAEAEANREHLADLMDSAGNDIDWFVLPETFATGFLGDGKREPEDMNGASIQWMKEQANKHQAAICGSLVIAENGKLYNRFIHVNKQGEVVCHYDKRHLFTYGGENERYTAGDQRVTYTMEDGDDTWRISPQICFDLRFPESCRYTKDHQYDLLVFVANWPEARIQAWKQLLIARAIENQCYVIGVNRVGPDGTGVVYGGCSGVYGPLGEVVVEMTTDRRLSAVKVCTNSIIAFRKRLPFLNEV